MAATALIILGIGIVCAPFVMVANGYNVEGNP